MFPNWRSFRVGQSSFHSEPLEDESFSLTRSSAYNGSVRWWRWRLGIPSLSQTAGSTTVCAVLVTFFSLLPRIVRSPGTTAYSTCPSFFRDCLACRSWNGLSENCVKRPSSSRLRCSQRRLGCGCRVSEQTTFAAGGIFGYQVWGRTAVAVPRFFSPILFFVEWVLRSFRPFNNFWEGKYICSEFAVFVCLSCGDRYVAVNVDDARGLSRDGTTKAIVSHRCELLRVPYFNTSSTYLTSCFTIVCSQPIDLF